jgi:site-specific recombinase XerD
MVATISPAQLNRTAFRRLAYAPGNLPLPPEGGNLRRLARSFGRTLEDRDLSPNTVSTYLTGIKKFGEFLDAHGMPMQVESITGEHIREYLRWLADSGQASNTRANRYKGLAAFFKWLVEEDEIRARDNPMLKIKRPVIQQAPPPILSDDNVSALLAACRGGDFEARRDMAIIRLFFDIGIRRSGLAYLRVQDVDIEHYPPTVTVVGKGQRGQRHVYTAAIGRKTASAMDRYLRAREHHKHAGEEGLWLGRQGALRDNAIALMLLRRGKQAGVTIHAHLFRHKFAHDQLSEPDVKEGDVLEQGGWRDPTMLRRYARSAAAERARQAHARKDLSSRL